MAAPVDLQLPPGFRFHPTDDELVIHYLCRKCASLSISVPIIAEVDLYKHDPWDLPGLALYGEKEWYFFSPRDRKYPNGSRPNRAAGRGYWKATGADKPIGQPKPIGIKKALVFYTGRAPRGEKTNWIMHEYRLADVDRSACKNKNSLRLDEWVLCRIYNKKGTVKKNNNNDQNISSSGSEMMTSAMTTAGEDVKPVITTLPLPAVYDDMVYLDASDSIARLAADSGGCSEEHVQSPEVENAAPKVMEWETDTVGLDFPYGYTGSCSGRSVPFPSQGGYYMEPMPDMFVNAPKPF